MEFRITSSGTPRLLIEYILFICAYAPDLETRDGASAKSGTVNPWKYLTALSGGG